MCETFQSLNDDDSTYRMALESRRPRTEKSKALGNNSLDANIKAEVTYLTENLDQSMKIIEV